MDQLRDVLPAMTATNGLTAETVLARFRTVQQAMYTGGELEPLTDLLAEDVVWHVPGTSPIAGDYRGRQAVLQYFRTRRELADHRLTLLPGEELHDEDIAVQVADGEATIGGHAARWRTVGVYRVHGGRIAEAWLIPIDLAAFDRIWSTAQPSAPTGSATSTGLVAASPEDVRQPRAPTRRKLAVVTWLAIYPALTALTALFGPLGLLDVPLPLRTLELTLILVPLMVFALMPALTRLLAAWPGR